MACTWNQGPLLKGEVGRQTEVEALLQLPEDMGVEESLAPLTEARGTLSGWLYLPAHLSV